MTKKIMIKYRGELCPLNQKDAPSASGKMMKYRPATCKLCRPIKYTTAKYKMAKEEIILRVKQHVQAQAIAMGGMFSKSDGNLLIDVIVYYKNTADWDAFPKIICDSLNGLAYTDDSLIKKAIVEIKEKQPESGFDMIITAMGQPQLFD